MGSKNYDTDIIKLEYSVQYTTVDKASKKQIEVNLGWTSSKKRVLKDYIKENEYLDGEIAKAQADIESSKDRQCEALTKISEDILTDFAMRKHSLIIVRRTITYSVPEKLLLLKNKDIIYLYEEIPEPTQELIDLFLDGEK